MTSFLSSLRKLFVFDVQIDGRCVCAEIDGHGFYVGGRNELDWVGASNSSYNSCRVFHVAIAQYLHVQTKSLRKILKETVDFVAKFVCLVLESADYYRVGVITHH